jgi:glycosyltransferase involved in cell wall biosynthesis
MRIGIYVDVARDERPTGIGKHVIYLLDALAKLDQDNQYLLYYPASRASRSEYLDHFPKQGNFVTRPVWFPQQWQYKRPRAWWNWYLPWVVRRDRIDVFHGPNHFLPKLDKRRNIVTIHDLAYFHMEVHGEEMDEIMRKWTQHALDNAGRVIALSENTKRDIERLGYPSDRIQVIYGGGNIVPENSIACGRVAEMREKLRLPKQFVLFIGALQPRKNVPFLLRGFARMKEKYSLPHELVLAGPKDTATDEILALSRELGVSEDVHLTGYLDDWQIPLLYREAELFALPTRYEGFTLVTLEAMAYGTPLVATDSSSIREGVGDAALLVEVDAVEHLADAMHRGLTDQTLRKDLVQRGKVQSAKFTWERCAEETLSLYTAVQEANMGRRRSHEGALVH